MREPLPDTRVGKTQKVTIFDMRDGEYDLYVRTGRYEDGRLGEVFAGIGKQGGTLQCMLDGWCIMVSIAMQHGAPLENIRKKFEGQNFSPSGRTTDKRIPECSSLLDYLVRFLALEEGGEDAPSGVS